MVALAQNTSETSSWDILDGFPKLHSRAREEKTRICTEAPRSKSLSRVEIWLVISESCDGLESFTRDPIGFEGSPYDLYEFLSSRALIRTDPEGKNDAYDPPVGNPNAGPILWPEPISAWPPPVRIQMERKGASVTIEVEIA